MKRVVGLSLSVLVLATGAAGGQPASAPEDGAQVQRGQVLLERNCASCHAVGRTGNSPLAAAPQFRVLGKRYPIESLEEALGEGLVSGHPAMPEFRFSPADVGAVIAYLNSIQEK